MNGACVILDEFPLSWTALLQRAIPVTLANALQEMESLGINLMVLKSRVIRRGGDAVYARHAQRECLKMLRALPSQRVFLETVVRPRLCRWLSQDRISGIEGLLCRRFAASMAQLKDLVPPSVLASCFRTMWNGWCCDRRFQRRRRDACRLSRQCQGEDSIEHYSCCSSTWEFARRRLRLSNEFHGLKYFLLLEALDDRSVALLALLVHVVYQTVNHLGVQGTRAGGNIDALLWERCRSTAVKHVMLERVLSNLWVVQICVL